MAYAPRPLPLKRPAIAPQAPAEPGRKARSVAPFLSLIIVNYGQWNETVRLVRSVVRSTPGRSGAVETVVVDNYSASHPASRKLRRWPDVSVRRWSRNRGFARAVNEGCRLSRGAWVLLVNPDVTLQRGFLTTATKLARRLTAQQPRAGIVGFQLRNTDGSLQLSTGPVPTLARTIAGLAFPRASRKYRRVHSQRLCRVAWVTGCCLLVRKDCFDDLQGLDEDFFLYYEDVDFCVRARRRGWTVWYEPRLQAVHHAPLHGRSVSPFLRVVTRHALLTFAAKHWTSSQLRLLATVVCAESWLRRLWAAHRGDHLAAGEFARLTAVAAAVMRSRTGALRQLLRRILRGEEDRLV